MQGRDDHEIPIYPIGCASVFAGRFTSMRTFIAACIPSKRQRLRCHGRRCGSRRGRRRGCQLSVALRLDQLLGLCGIPSKLTRDSDNIAYPDSAETTRQRKRADQEFRAALIRGTEKAVLISIHQNNYIAPGPKGAQVFYGRVPGSKEFASVMQDMLSVLCGDHRKAAPVSEDIYLLRQAACPSILVECGFLSNPEELALLKTETYRTKLALVLAAGCFRQYRELEAEYGKS